jgi:hypothetical protein
MFASRIIASCSLSTIHRKKIGLAATQPTNSAMQQERTNARPSIRRLTIGHLVKSARYSLPAGDSFPGGKGDGRRLARKFKPEKHLPFLGILEGI